MKTINDFIEMNYKLIVSGSLMSITVLILVSVFYLKSISEATTSAAISASGSESALQSLEKYGIQILPN